MRDFRPMRWLRLGIGFATAVYGLVSSHEAFGAAPSPIGPYGAPTAVCSWGSYDSFTGRDSTPGVDWVRANMSVIPTASSQWVAYKPWFWQMGTGRWFEGEWSVTSATNNTILDDGFLQQWNPQVRPYGGTGWRSVPPYFEYLLTMEYSWNVGNGWTSPRVFRAGDARAGSGSYYIHTSQNFLPYDRCSLVPQNYTFDVTLSTTGAAARALSDLQGRFARDRVLRASPERIAVSAAACEDQPATITGTSGDDVLYGTNRPDVIAGLDGNDTIYGFGGADLICGGVGQDGIVGGSKDDHLLGDAENDTILGGTGNDWIEGDSGFDAIEPQDGNDHAEGGPGGGVIAYLDAPGPQNIDLGAGSSDGSAGDDTFSGFRAVFGSEYDDQLVGSARNDQFVPFEGDDQISGGAGIDAIYFFESLVSSTATRVQVDLKTHQATGEGIDFPIEGVEAVFGTPFEDEIRGDVRPNFLAGSGGNDTLDGRGGLDDLYGGDGTDTCLRGENYVSCENQVGDIFVAPPTSDDPPIPS